MIYYSKDLCSYVHNLGSWESKARKSSGLKEMEQFKPVFFFLFRFYFLNCLSCMYYNLQ